MLFLSSFHCLLQRPRVSSPSYTLGTLSARKDSIPPRHPIPTITGRLLKGNKEAMTHLTVRLRLPMSASPETQQTVPQ
jgi:hypothetical protein